MPFEYTDIPNFAGGINKLVSPDLLKENQLENAENVFIEDGKLKTAQGFSCILPDVLAGSEIPRLLHEFLLIDGTIRYILFGNESVYHAVTDPTADSGAWSIVTGGSAHSLGVDGFQPRAVTIPWPDLGGNAMVVFTYGIGNVMQYYNDAGTWKVRDMIELDGGDRDIEAVKELVVWNNRLFLMNLTDGSTVAPQRIIWSEPGDAEGWDGTTTSGHFDIFEKEDPIYRAETLGAHLYVYKEKTIYRGDWIGAAYQTLDFTEVVSGFNLLGVGAVTTVGEWHIMITKQGIFKYSGGNNLENIGASIKTDLFGLEGSFSVSGTHYVFTKHLVSLNEVWFLFRSESSDIAYTTFYIYNTIFKSWTKRIIKTRIYSITEFAPSSDDTWDSGPALTWDEESTLLWDTHALTTGFPTIFMPSDTGNANEEWLLNIDFIKTRDFQGETKETSISYYFDTKEFRFPDKKMRIDLFELSLSGDGTATDFSLRVDIKVDEQAWSTMGYITASDVTTTRTFHRVFGQYTGRSFQFRIAGTDGSPTFYRAGFKHIFESEY